MTYPGLLEHFLGMPFVLAMPYLGVFFQAQVGRMLTVVGVRRALYAQTTTHNRPTTTQHNYWEHIFALDTARGRLAMAASVKTRNPNSKTLTVTGRQMTGGKCPDISWHPGVPTADDRDFRLVHSRLTIQT